MQDYSLLLQVVEFANMLLFDLVFILVLILVMLPLGIWRQSAFAVMKRNFVGYFSNPTGYVFLCLFVLLTSFAAFWPHEFFTTNLANFDQLNQYLPYIMLIFIPAITMSIWAEERRQGTDELLLTLPAKDFDIVIGKYFAAMLVFTVSLLFSQLSNYAVLIAMTGGQLDSMLLFSTYLGYWLIGISMLAIGMVASFLTSNLTVGFIFGAAFNAPLAFFSNADVILSNSTSVQRFYEWSLLQRFEPFGRGLISLPGVFYFFGIIILGIYLSMILIGRRHWLGGRDGTSMLSHYVMRASFLLISVVGIVLIAQHSPLNHLRVDVSVNKVSTLADSTTEVLNELAQEKNEDGSDPPQIKIDAYISNNVPTEFVQTRNDLINLLREFDVMGGKRIQVNLRQGINPFSKDAIEAEQRFGIRPTKVTSQSRGAIREEDVILGVSFASGLERIVIPFMHAGMPVEYELMRSINTVAKSERKTIGVVTTDAFITGATVQAQGQQPTQLPRFLIIQELEKQYNVESVEARDPISLWHDEDSQGNTGDQDSGTKKRRYDVLVVVQPSAMTPPELTHLIAAIQQGQPTIIFEDPLPAPENYGRNVRSTFMPRSINRGGAEKGDIQLLFDALELDIDRRTRQGLQFPNLVWQSSSNPYPRDRQLDLPERIIVSKGESSVDLRFSDHPVTKGITELYFQFAGYLRKNPNADLHYEALVQTDKAGRILLDDWLRAGSNEIVRNQARGTPNQNYVLAAHITGKNVAQSLNDDGTFNQNLGEKVSETPTKANTNVIYVCDIDVLSDYFVAMRNYPIRNGIHYRFQNMAFVLNAIDTLANEFTYLEIRNRRERHVTLRVVEQTTEDAMEKVYDATQDFEKDLEASKNDIQTVLTEDLRPLAEEIQKMEADQRSGLNISLTTLNAKKRMFEQMRQEKGQKAERKVRELDNERREKLRSIQLEAELEIQEIQRYFKLAAVVIPPIPPLLVGLIVFSRRRLREREGISKARRLK